MGNAYMYVGYFPVIQQNVEESITELFEDKVSSWATNDEMNDTLTMLLNISHHIENITKNSLDVTFDRNLMKRIQEKAQAITEKVNKNEYSA